MVTTTSTTNPSWTSCCRHVAQEEDAASPSCRLLFPHGGGRPVRDAFVFMDSFQINFRCFLGEHLVRIWHSPWFGGSFPYDFSLFSISWSECFLVAHQSGLKHCQRNVVGFTPKKFCFFVRLLIMLCTYGSKILRSDTPSQIVGGLDSIGNQIVYSGQTNTRVVTVLCQIAEWSGLDFPKSKLEFKSIWTGPILKIKFLSLWSLDISYFRCKLI